MTPGLTLIASTGNSREAAYDRDPRFVYFIQAASGGPIKVGVASDPARRMAVLQPGNPERLRIIGVIRGGGCARERDLHVRFAASRMHGEWFESTPELLTLIESAAVSFDSVSTEEIDGVYRRTQSEHERASLGLDIDGPGLRSLRKSLGMSPSVLANKAGISHQFLSFIERGQRRPLPPVFDRICDALELPDDDRDELLMGADRLVA